MRFASRRNKARGRNWHRPLRLHFEVLEAREMLAAADLSGWIGSGNTSSPNNYTASTTTAGGTFDDRRFGGGQTAAYLADTSLTVSGGVLTASTVGGFGATGTITIDASINNSSLADPVFYFGFFDKDDLTKGAFGFSMADSSTSALRFRASAGTTQTSGNGTVIGDGTYTFDLDVNNSDSGANTVRFRLFNAVLTTVLNVTVSTSGNTLQADSFGFLQPLAGSAADATFGITLSNINYTGETQISGPIQVALPGDYNNNAVVDTGDFVVWRENNGQNVTLPNDTTPGTVAQADYNVWRANFGNVLPAPAAPSNLLATAAGSTQINLTWTDNASSPIDETGFKIDRATDSNFTSNLTTVSVAANATNYLATGLTANTTYYFRVRATNAGGDSANSNTATTTTTSPAVSISATNYSRTQIYHGSQAAAYLAGDPSYTAWSGIWEMPNGDLMVGFTQVSGREKPVHNNPAPYDFSNLDVDVVYLRGVRANDGSGNVTWTKVTESDVSFTTAADSGLGTGANVSATTIALNDGSLLRRVYGWDYEDFTHLPGTTFMQRSTDGGLTWSPAPTTSNGGLTWSDPSPIQEFLLDPATSTVQMTRTMRLSDGRLLIGGSVWNGPHTQSASNDALLMVSADEGVSWQRVTFSGPAYNSIYFNEWDFTELDNGDLFIVSRPKSNMGRYEGVMTKVGNTWQLTSWNLTTLPHSGHPELLTTQQGPVLHIATTGTSWTNDNGATWNTLSGGAASLYYPDSLQTADGWVYVVSHRPSPGGDDNYGGANQAIFLDKFKLVATPLGGANVPEGDSTFVETPSDSDIGNQNLSTLASLYPPQSTLFNSVGGNKLATSQADQRQLAAENKADWRLIAIVRTDLADDFDMAESIHAGNESATDEALSSYGLGPPLREGVAGDCASGASSPKLSRSRNEWAIQRRK